MEETKLTEEQAEKVKENLYKQLDKFPEDKREQMREQIDLMSAKEVKEFIKQNQSQGGGEDPCIFCSIVQGKIPSYKIAEDENNLAILELNPATKGHVLIVPKNHSSNQDSMKEFAIKVGEDIQKKLGAKEIKVQDANILGHNLLNIIPTYEDTDLEKMEKKPTNEEDLKNLQSKLISQKELVKKEPLEIPKPKKPEPIQKLNPRIP